MKTLVYTVICIGLLALTACSVDHKDESSTSETSQKSTKVWIRNDKYGYKITSEKNGKSCSTGKREFWSLNGMCNGLTDDLSNKECGKSQRKAVYSNYCGDADAAF